MKARCTQAILWGGLIVAAVGGAFASTIEMRNQWTILTAWADSSYEPLYIVANAISFHLCRKILRDHQEHSTARIAWTLLAAACAAAIVRHSFELMCFVFAWNNTMPNTLVSLRQIPTTLAMVFMIAGLIAMWSAFAAIGLGVGFRRRDAILPLCILLSAFYILVYRQYMNDSGSVYAVMRYLQWSSPIQIGMAAILGLALQRIEQEIGSGQLANSLRYLVWSLLLRLISLLIGLSPELRRITVLAFAGKIAFWIAPWVFGLGILNRWHLTVRALEQVARYEINTAQEIAGLSSYLVSQSSPGAKLQK